MENPVEEIGLVTQQNRINEEIVRRWVVDEVARQILPLSARLESIDRWKLSLWSNGSGGPPGYLETARKEDDERYTRLFKTVDDFGDHKEQVVKFITVLEEKEKQQEVNRKLLIKVGSVLGTALVSFMLWLAHQSVPIVKVLWNDYVHAHPAVEQQLRRQTSESNQPVYAGESATLPKVR